MTDEECIEIIRKTAVQASTLDRGWLMVRGADVEASGVDLDDFHLVALGLGLEEWPMTFDHGDEMRPGRAGRGVSVRMDYKVPPGLLDAA